MFTSANAAACAALRTRIGRPKPRSQILRMQAALLADVESKDTPAGYRAQCARAWEVLEERLRIMDGKPLPGQLRPDLDQKRNARRKPTLLASLPSDPPPADMPPSQAQF
jgi:hypothetical protein